VLSGFATLCPANLVRHFHVRHFQSTRLFRTMIGLSSAGIALTMAVAQLLCMTGADETIRSVRGSKQIMSHIVNECPLTKYPGGLQPPGANSHCSADEDSIK